MQVSLSPTARLTRVAVTVESTPPERAQMTRPSPTCSLILATASSMKEAGVHVPFNPQTLYRKLRMIAPPWGV